MRIQEPISGADLHTLTLTPRCSSERPHTPPAMVTPMAPHDSSQPVSIHRTNALAPSPLQGHQGCTRGAPAVHFARVVSTPRRANRQPGSLAALRHINQAGAAV